MATLYLAKSEETSIKLESLSVNLEQQITWLNTNSDSKTFISVTHTQILQYHYINLYAYCTNCARFTQTTDAMVSVTCHNTRT